MGTKWTDLCRVMALALLLAACSRSPEPLYIEAIGLGAMPPWRSESDARMRARAVAEKEALQYLMYALTEIQMEGYDAPLQDLLVRSPDLQMDFIQFFGRADTVDLADPANGIVAVLARVDADRLYRLVRKHIPLPGEEEDAGESEETDAEKEETYWDGIDEDDDESETGDSGDEP